MLDVAKKLSSRLVSSKEWQPPQVPLDIPQGDVPGAHIDIFPGNVEQTKVIFRPLLEEMSRLAKKQDKVVIGVAGGSGVGKTGISSILTYYFRAMGIGAYMLSGDNYPHRIPIYNDAERLRCFRGEGLLRMIEDGVYTKERFDIIQKHQEEFSDADQNHCQLYPWYASYLAGGREGLEGYLGTDKELDFEALNQIIADFKAGKESIYLKRMGRSDTQLWYEAVDMSSCNVLIIEWTHSNSDFCKGIDIPIFLNSTPQETLEYRRKRNKDGNVDSPFVSLVLEIEQNLLKSQAHKAKIIVSRAGHLLTYEEYVALT